MISIREIRDEINIYKKLRLKLSNRLKGLPKGKLRYRFQHGKERPYRLLNGKATYIRRSQTPLVQSLKLREEIEDTIERLTNNIDGLATLLASYIDFDVLMKAVSSLSGESKPLPELSGSSQDIDNLHGRGIYITSDGVHVRSRIELILYEIFLSHGLKVIYEPEIMIDGQVWHPDFALIRERDGAVILWEHYGMMDDPDYRKQTLWKVNRYCTNGYLPFHNFVCTFGYRDSSIDVSHVNDILRTMQLI